MPERLREIGQHLIRHNLLDAFISNLGPIVIALILLFAIQMSIMADEKKAAFMQLTSGRLVNICVSMFFVIVFAHISVRRSLAAEEIFYLEYFYFTTYLGLLLVIMNGILFASNSGGAVVEFRDNLVPKIAYWPAAMTCLFIVTLMVFY